MPLAGDDDVVAKLYQSPPFVLTAPPADMPSPTFDRLQQKWVSLDADYANKAAAEAKQAADEAAKQVTLTKDQLTQVNGVLVKAAEVIAAPAAASTVDDKTAMALADMWPTWSASAVKYTKGQIVSYDGHLYRVVQDHTSQADWLPGNAPSLFAPITIDNDGIEEWTQPGGAYNAYAKGKQVKHNGHIWESLVDSNNWEPTADATTLWKQVS
ncbi:hypothetical protein L248_1708 [Schleiferilactobacillus shenzhenensis LY-73]|uniref:Chitin-binding type-3 domain-containing protein n=1 Tax=Schleiferilactobacillus shenzhenensis LY-73 TaxID=1231336 RepID=U4TGZ1_9LACO|nr:hypothetical protein L248_1708 [Schleiferilactobacillus shenzhenensis LY-73]